MISLVAALACAGKPVDSTDPDERPDLEDTSGDTDETEGTKDTETGEPTGGGGRTGLEGFCDYYIECGGSYYSDAQDCIDASLAYWGECRRPELDAFGDCMLAEFTCDSWNPDTYNPSGGACGEEWAALGNAEC